MGIEVFLGLFTVEFFYATIRMASPIALAALGEVYVEKAGILNLGIEATMLMGAFFGVLGSALSGSAFVGVLTAMAAGMLTGLLFGFLVITMRANQIVTGAALNIAALGMTSFLSRIIFGVRLLPVQVQGIKPLPIPFLKDIPGLGKILFEQTPLVYFTYFMVIVMTYALYRTTWGLKIRSVGEHPRAAETLGISVIRWRYGCVLLGGALGGIAGSILSLAQLSTFVDNMIAGRGFIALAAVIFGRWNPLGAAAAALVFGAADAMQMRVQAFSLNLPSDFLLMLPYLITLIGVIIFRGRAAAPVALTKPYEKEATA
ncbi:MAG: ABC transporter permease [Anaerolineaceae bacterium]|nr:ABC transporter permease [Anaerolineaceae bacterium]